MIMSSDLFERWLRSMRGYHRWYVAVIITDLTKVRVGVSTIVGEMMLASLERLIGTVIVEAADLVVPKGSIAHFGGCGWRP